MLGGSGVHVGEQKEEEKEAQVRGEAPEECERVSITMIATVRC